MAAATAYGQGAPAENKNTTELEEVVVTGSFIKGSPEDAAMPVEVISYEELLDLGRPSNLDLIKNMSESGGVAGEANRVNFYPIGSATINLRSLGSRFTTVVFNGRRFPEQFSVNTGRFNNIAWIPNAAIGSVETLKAGGGATYGADAVAGVVNYITRKNFDGLELNADYRYINNSDGDYNADALWGKKWDTSNLMISLSYQHRSKLREIDRSWSQYSYLENPASWQFATFPTSNPGSLVFQRPVAGVQTSFTPASTPTSNLQMGPTGVVRDVGCAELGGFRGWSPTASPSCYTNTAEMEDLVSEANNYNLYLEHNITLGESLKFHTELLLFRQDIPEIALASTFVSNPASWPLLASVGGAPQALQNVGGTSAYFVAGANPAVGYLLGQLKNSDGSTAFTGGVGGQIDQITTGGGRVGLLNTLWKPFGNGGSPLTGPYDLQEGHLKMIRVTEAVSGDLPEFWGTKLEWEVGLTYGKINDVKQANDILVDRMQAALNGLGGANCTGATPGAGGCQYFNPFSSAIPSNVFTGAQNPGYVSGGTYPGYLPAQGLINDPSLVAWMYVPVQFERIYHNYVVDPIIRGDLGWELPGGPVAIAIGGQFREQTEDTVLDWYTDRNINPCPTLGVTNCAATAQLGSMLYNRAGNVFGAAASNYRAERRRYPVAAGFFETKLPLLQTLDLTIAGRYERFFSDVSDKDNSVFVPAAAVKWQPIDWLGVRASWGKTFSQVNPPAATAPIAGTSAGSAKYTGLGGAPNTYSTFNYPNVDVEPEKGTYLDVGFLVNVGNFSGNIDYYDIRIDDYTRTMAVANVLDGLAMPGAVTGPAATTPVNCSSGVLTQAIAALGNRPLVELPGGNASCVQGTTMMSALAGGRVNYFAANGQTNSGELITNGIDVSMRYRFDNVLGGTLTPSIDYSQVLKWQLGDFVVSGVKLADGYDGLGYVNLSTGRTGISVAKYRGTVGIAYRREGHTLNIQTQYVPSIINENPTDFAANVGRNANIGDATGITANGNVCTVTPAGLTGPINTDLGNVPAGAGSGQFGTGTIAGTAGVTPGFGSRGFCNAQNAAPQAGQEIDALFNVDVIYRVELPSETALTVTITNLLDQDPSFFRGIVPYNTAYGSPLGRTYKMGISKKF
jgi:iron complex outermembrane receptor protein